MTPEPTGPLQPSTAGRGLLRGLVPLAVFAALQLVLVMVSAYDLGTTADVLRIQQAQLRRDLDANPAPAAIQFFMLYVAASTLLLPGASLLSLSAGAVFGLVGGVLIASTASTIGAWVAFAVTRGLLAPWVLRSAPAFVLRTLETVDRRSLLWLLAARLTPLAPFSLVNVLFGLTTISSARFVLVSWLGMLPGTIAYVRLGTELYLADMQGEIVSPLQLMPVAPLYGLTVVGLALAAYAVVSQRRHDRTRRAG